MELVALFEGKVHKDLTSGPSEKSGLEQEWHLMTMAFGHDDTVALPPLVAVVAPKRYVPKLFGPRRGPKRVNVADCVMSAPT